MSSGEPVTTMSDTYSGSNSSYWLPPSEMANPSRNPSNDTVAVAVTGSGVFVTVTGWVRTEGASAPTGIMVATIRAAITAADTTTSPANRWDLTMTSSSLRRTPPRMTHWGSRRSGRRVLWRVVRWTAYDPHQGIWSKRPRTGGSRRRTQQEVDRWRVA